MYRNYPSRHYCHRRQQWRDQRRNMGTKRKNANWKEHKTLSEDTHVLWCCLMIREASPIIFLFSYFTNTHDESPRQLTQAKYAVIQSQTVWRCNRVETLCHFQKHVLTLCVAVSLMLRMKDNLPKGTIQVSLVVETAEENSSNLKSYLSAISWTRLLLQRIGEIEFENPELEELDQLSRYKVMSIFA